MNYAIIATGGGQLRVEPGRFYDVNRLDYEPESALTLDQVLLVQTGSEVLVGQPYVAGAVVEAVVMQHLRGPKIIVYKMRKKKKTRKKQGHRQELTRISITGISLNSQSLDPEADATTAIANTPSTSDSMSDAADTADVGAEAVLS